MKDRKLFIGFLKKYGPIYAFSRFYAYIDKNKERYKNTFLSGGNFKSTGYSIDDMDHKSGGRYSEFIRRATIEQVAKELGL